MLPRCGSEEEPTASSRQRPAGSTSSTSSPAAFTTKRGSCCRTRHSRCGCMPWPPKKPAPRPYGSSWRETIVTPFRGVARHVRRHEPCSRRSPKSPRWARPSARRTWRSRALTAEVAAYGPRADATFSGAPRSGRIRNLPGRSHLWTCGAASSGVVPGARGDTVELRNANGHLVIVDGVSPSRGLGGLAAGEPVHFFVLERTEDKRAHGRVVHPRNFHEHPPDGGKRLRRARSLPGLPWLNPGAA